MASILNRTFARGVGIRIYGLGAIALGLVGLTWGNFAALWQPLPNGVPGKSVWGYAVAVAFLLGGLALQWRRSAAPGALALIAFYCIGVIVLDMPSGIAQPLVFGAWYGVAEHLALAAGGLVAYVYCARLELATAKRLSKIGCVLFGGCLIYFGLAHHVYLAYTAKMVPGWLPPGQVFWAYATAVGHIAAGIAILSGFAVRPAAMLLTAMFVVFAIWVHAPTIFVEPHRHFYWAENATNFALIGSAWVMAAPLPSRTSGAAP